ncbi:MAG: TVP38/TMEM64 family protein [Aestuariivirgaceae bacterium]
MKAAPPVSPSQPMERSHVHKLGRWLPMLALLLAAIAVWASGLHGYLSLSAIAENRETLRGLVAGNMLLAIAAYAFVYVAVTAFLVPGAALLTILGGFLFGWAVAGVVTVFAATTGATLLFIAARSSFGDLVRRRGGNLVNTLASRFSADAFSYLLFLRLVPLFPFFVVNIAPALCNIRTQTFVLATLIGIIPGTFAFAVLGSGLDGIIRSEHLAYRQCVAEKGASACSFDISPAALLTPELLAAFAFLALLALVSPLVKRLVYRKNAGSTGR